MNCEAEPVDWCHPELSIPAESKGRSNRYYLYVAYNDINIKFPVTSLRNSTNFHYGFAPVHPCLAVRHVCVRHANGLILIKAFYEKSKT